MRLIFPFLTLAAAICTPCLAATARPVKPETLESQDLPYADIADLADRAPVMAIATITKAEWLHKELAVNVPAGHARLLVTATVNALLRGDQGLPPRITYLIDAPLDAANRPPKLRKRKVLIAATPVPGKPDMVRLVAADAQFPWTAGNETRTRTILADLLRPDAPPRITGVGNAFHVRGTLPGESETQIFLKTADERPVSLTILRRPGQQPRWSVALGEMVDESAPQPLADTLLWYRLACFLPRALPGSTVADMSADDGLAIASDYRLVMDQLGPCARN